MRFFQRRYQENTTLLNICKYVADVCVVIVLAYVLVTYAAVLQLLVILWRKRCLMITLFL
jgi:hypothetical protein